MSIMNFDPPDMSLDSGEPQDSQLRKWSIEKAIEFFRCEGTVGQPVRLAKSIENYIRTGEDDA